jgi:hypothetical protein
MKTNITILMSHLKTNSTFSLISDLLAVVRLLINIPFLRRSWDWHLNLGLRICKAGVLPLEPHLQSILLWLFWRWGSCCLLGLASNLHLLDPSLPSSCVLLIQFACVLLKVFCTCIYKGYWSAVLCLDLVSG